MATEIDNFSLYSIAQLYFFLNRSSIGNSCPYKIISVKIRAFCIFVVCEQAVIKSGRVYRVWLSVKCIWFPLSFLKAAAVDKTKKAI